MLVKIEPKENESKTQYINTDKIQRMFKGKHGEKYELCIDFGNDGANIYRDTEEEIDQVIDQVIQAPKRDETIFTRCFINRIEERTEQLKRDIEYLKKLESGYKPKNSDFVEEVE